MPLDSLSVPDQRPFMVTLLMKTACECWMWKPLPPTPGASLSPTIRKWLISTFGPPTIEKTSKSSRRTRIVVLRLSPSTATPVLMTSGCVTR